MNLNQLLASLEQSAGIEKKASDTEEVKPSVTAELAGVLEKKASEDITKQAFAQGEELARQLLSKLANEIQTDNAIMAAQDDTKIVPTETGGTVEQALEATVNEAVSRGATSDDRVDEELDNSEEKMNKQAQENNQLAVFIMEKLAQEFNPQVSTPAAQVNVYGAAVPNMIQVDNAVMTAQDDAKVQGVVPGGDGTVNALFESIVAKAVAEGAGSDNLVDANVAVPGAGSSIQEDEVEKAAAVSALCDAGMDFDSAITLVKQAEQAILEDSWEVEKQACVNQLMDEGLDFDTAVALTKQAEEDLFEKEAMKAPAAALGLAGKLARSAKATERVANPGIISSVSTQAKGLTQKALDKLNGVKGQISDEVLDVRTHPKGALGYLNEKTNAGNLAHQAGDAAKDIRLGVINKDSRSYIGQGVRRLASNNLVRAGVGAGAVGAAGAGYAAYRHNEKQACLNDLMAEGIDFDTAVALTKQAELEVYGE